MTVRGLHVRGYQEEGTTTTPFDMVMLNDLDRFPAGARGAGGLTAATHRGRRPRRDRNRTADVAGWRRRGPSAG